MSDAKDPAIKLFGRTIPVPEIVAAASAPVPSPSSSSGSGSAEEGLGENRPASSSSPPEDEESNRVETEGEFDKVSSRGNGIDGQQGDVALPLASEELTDADTSSVVNENPKEKAPSSKPEEEQSETSNSQEKPLKKPDKILPCPRCTSMETKFCYYNNYNVNQPRHFCKNCQRYWTAGGTMRNVPVGAGRRKNKNLASHYRHITVSEALQNGQNDIRNAINGPLLKTNGPVLAFGSDTPLCESMTTALNLADKTAGGCTQGGVPRPEELRVPENDRASGSVVTDSNSRDHAGKTRLQEPVMQNYNGFNPQMPALPGASWPYPWNAAQWSSPVPPPFYPAGFTVPFYPAATYWSCSVSGTWNVPWVSQPSSPSHLAPNSGPNSPTLGKHSRDENSLKPNDTGEEEPIKEKSFWVPKTLRIDDPGEAAKSSIWATLGIKNDKVESPNGRGVFKAFQSKNGEKNHVTEAPPTLQANPAALSRSQNFQERS